MDHRAACARLVEEGDPERFAAARLAGESAWKLHALYAFNLEVARIPGVVSEQLLGEIRLQWWRDVIEEIYAGKEPRAHEVVAPLSGVIREAGLPRAPFDALLDARAQDVTGLKLSGGEALDGYLAATSGGLMQLAALALGGDQATGDVAREVGTATGLGRMILALPALADRGAQPVEGMDAAALVRGQMPAALAEGLRGQAQAALARLAAARARRPEVVPEALPALLADWWAEPALKAAARPGFDLFGDAALESEFRKRGRLAWRAVTGRY
ncbi:phytoene/squalene synthase family protein [Rhodovulum sp. DZ06]|uniref:phytoene/squalene synthase family protein n=1 Tax=Rhodovulum sp. DZ06 TaxID=3425126 RepID=UPI003D341F41